MGKGGQTRQSDCRGQRVTGQILPSCSNTPNLVPAGTGQEGSSKTILLIPGSGSRGHKVTGRAGKIFEAAIAGGEGRAAGAGFSQSEFAPIEPGS